MAVSPTTCPLPPTQPLRPPPWTRQLCPCNRRWTKRPWPRRWGMGPRAGMAEMEWAAEEEWLTAKLWKNLKKKIMPLKSFELNSKSSRLSCKSTWRGWVRCSRWLSCLMRKSWKVRFFGRCPTKPSEFLKLTWKMTICSSSTGSTRTSARNSRRRSRNWKIVNTLRFKNLHKILKSLS